MIISFSLSCLCVCVPAIIADVYAKLESQEYCGKAARYSNMTRVTRGSAGTNTAEQIIFKYHISNASLAKAFSYGGSLENTSSCMGLRSSFYAKANKQ